MAKRLKKVQKLEFPIAKPSRKLPNLPYFQILPWVLLFAVIGYGLWNRPGDGVAPDDDLPTKQIIETATQAYKQYAHNNSKSYDRIAELVESQKITNIEQFQANAKPMGREALNHAFAPLRNLDKEQIPEEFEGEYERLAEYFRCLSKGAAEAAK